MAETETRVGFTSEDIDADQRTCGPGSRRG
jgi:hypothetical protein